MKREGEAATEATEAPFISIDTDSPVPPFEQIRSQLADLITTGMLPAGTKLPPIRQLAADIDLAPGTVARAYRALEQAGLTTGRARTGTTVAAQIHPAPLDENVLAQLNAAARTYAATVRGLRLTRAHAYAALAQQAADLPRHEAGRR